MHREGHIGAALAAYAPLGAVVLALGFETAAVGGAVGAVGLAMVLDYDQQVPWIKHRGVTHTVRFAVVVLIATALLGAFLGYLHPETALLETIGLSAFGAAVGGITILSHIGADALTPMGVEPFDDGQHYSLEVCRADSVLWNYGLLVFGLIVALVAYGIGVGVNAVLPV